MESHSFSIVLCSLVGLCTAWLTPSKLVGVCTASCHTNPMFPCIYTPTYSVEFLPDGTFSWNAPYANGSGEEVGHGLILSPVTERRWPNGSWTAQWYGGNAYKPDPTNTTHCACYYIAGSPNGSIVLHNYPVEEAVNTSEGASVREVCNQYCSDCPEEEHEALEKYGTFWLETLEKCDVSSLNEE